MSITNSLNQGFLKFQFGLKVRINLYKKIASFLNNNVPIHKIVIDLRDEYRKYKKNDIRAIVLDDIQAEMSRSGNSFGQCMRKWIPESEFIIIESGEKTGSLTDAFDNAILCTESARRMSSTLKSQLAYPFFLILMLAVMIYVFSTKAVPDLVAVLPVDQWNDSSKRLYDVSIFVKNDWWMVVATLASVIAFMLFTIKSTTGKFRMILNKLPPWSIYKSFHSSTFLITVAAMMKTGKPIFESISQIKDGSSGYIKWEINKILDEEKKGASYGDSININGFLEAESAIDVAVYSRISALDSALDTIGKNAIEAGIEKITLICILLKNLVVLSMGLYMGWVYLAFYALTQQIGNTNQFM